MVAFGQRYVHDIVYQGGHFLLVRVGGLEHLERRFPVGGDAFYARHYGVAVPLEDEPVEFHGVGHFFLRLHVKPVRHALQVQFCAFGRHAQVKVSRIKFGVHLLVHSVFNLPSYFHFDLRSYRHTGPARGRNEYT
ncbi:MAG: hypothetical protein NTY45_04610 [Elusimicrobia bacterium]|nr:hypothetical protein [Elusimicrobiota bacterium]